MLQWIDHRPGRMSGEDWVTLSLDGTTAAAWGLLNRGAPARGIRPWADLVVADLGVLRPAVDWVGPGGAVMVAYKLDDTERALRGRVPPAATRIGLALLDAGCRWFKDWYFAEGGPEGGTKLQGTVPMDPSHDQIARIALTAELQGFLQADSGGTVDRERATRALDLLNGVTL